MELFMLFMYSKGSQNLSSLMVAIWLVILFF